MKKTAEPIRKALAKGDSIHALKLARQACRQNQNDVSLQILYITALWQSGDMLEALTKIRELARQYPENIEVLERLAQFEWNDGRLDIALAAYEQILASNKEHVGALLGSAAVLRRLNHLDNAFNRFMAAYTLTCVKHPLLLLELPPLLEAFTITLSHWEIVLNIFSGCTDPNRLIAIARAARLQGHFSFAEDWLNHALLLNPSLHDIRLEAARLCQDANQTEKGIETLQPLLASGIASAVRALAFFELGQCYRISKNYTAAKEAFCTAISEDSANPLPRCYLGALYMETGDIVSAEKTLLDILSEKPNTPNGWFLLAQTYILSRKIDPWFAAMAKVDEYGVDNSRLRQWNAVNRAVGLYLANRVNESLNELMKNKAILLRSDSASQFYLIYGAYIYKLIQWRADNQNWFGVGHQDGLIHVIGESHALSPNFGLVSIDGKNLRCVSHWIPGCKQWHLAQSGINRYNAAFSSVITQLPQGSCVLIAIGEIDTRPNEGMWRYSQKSGVAIENIVASTINGFLSYLRPLLAEKQFGKIIIQGVPAPNHPLEDRLDPGDRSEYLKMIKNFNSELKTKVLRLGYIFLDVYSATVAEDGISNQNWHIDAFHLKPGFYSEAQRWMEQELIDF